MRGLKTRAHGYAHARAGLLGNPSDGYGGKAIGLCMADLSAQATKLADDVTALVAAKVDAISDAVKARLPKS